MLNPAADHFRACTPAMRRSPPPQTPSTVLRRSDDQQPIFPSTHSSRAPQGYEHLRAGTTIRQHSGLHQHQQQPQLPPISAISGFPVTRLRFQPPESYHYGQQHQQQQHINDTRPRDFENHGTSTDGPLVEELQRRGDQERQGRVAGAALYDSNICKCFFAR